MFVLPKTFPPLIMSNNSPDNDHFVNSKRALLIRKAINDNNHTSDFNNLSEKGHIVHGKRAFLIGVQKKGGVPTP